MEQEDSLQYLQEATSNLYCEPVDFLRYSLFLYSDHYTSPRVSSDIDSLALTTAAHLNPHNDREWVNNGPLNNPWQCGLHIVEWQVNHVTAAHERSSHAPTSRIITHHARSARNSLTRTVVSSVRLLNPCHLPTLRAHRPPPSPTDSVKWLYF
jgi:hypothetical protein